MGYYFITFIYSAQFTLLAMICFNGTQLIPHYFLETTKKGCVLMLNCDCKHSGELNLVHIFATNFNCFLYCSITIMCISINFVVAYMCAKGWVYYAEFMFARIVAHSNKITPKCTACTYQNTTMDDSTHLLNQNVFVYTLQSH